MAITDRDKILQRKRTAQKRNNSNDFNNIGMVELPSGFPMTATPSDNPPPHSQDQMTDILPSSSVQDMGTPLGVINNPYTRRLPIPQDILDRKTYGMTPSMPDANPLVNVIQSNNARIPAPGYQPSVPMDREPPKQVLQSQPESKEVTSYKPPKPKKSIYESLRERRAQKQPAKKETPKPSVNRAIKPMQARQAGSSMRSLALQNMKRDKQATDVAQAKTDAIQAEIAKLRRK